MFNFLVQLTKIGYGLKSVFVEFFCTEGMKPNEMLSKHIELKHENKLK